MKVGRLSEGLKVGNNEIGIKQMEKTLEYYARHSTYQPEPYNGKLLPPSIQNDKGYNARRCLAACEKAKGEGTVGTKALNEK